jgi:hypothetical protein
MVELYLTTIVLLITGAIIFDYARRLIRRMRSRYLVRTKNGHEHIVGKMTLARLDAAGVVDFVVEI